MFGTPSRRWVGTDPLESTPATGGRHLPGDRRRRRVGVGAEGDSDAAERQHLAALPVHRCWCFRRHRHALRHRATRQAVRDALGEGRFRCRRYMGVVLSPPRNGLGLCTVRPVEIRDGLGTDGDCWRRALWGTAAFPFQGRRRGGDVRRPLVVLQGSRILAQTILVCPLPASRHRRRATRQDPRGAGGRPVGLAQQGRVHLRGGR